MLALTKTPKHYLRFVGDLTDSIGSFDGAGGTGVAVNSNFAGFSHAADYTSATTPVNLNAHVATIKTWTAFTIAIWVYLPADVDSTVWSLSSSAVNEVYNGLTVWWQAASTPSRLVFTFDNTAGAGIDTRLRVNDGLNLNEWNHVAVSGDASGHHVVVNGVDVNDSATYSNGAKTNNVTPAALTTHVPNTFYIGASADASVDPRAIMAGAFTRFVMDDTKWSVAQMQQLYADTKQRYKIVGSFGQSNAVGHNSQAILDGAGQADEPNRRVLQWGRGAGAPAGAGSISDGSIGIASQPLHHHADTAVLPDTGNANNVGAEMAFAKAILGLYDEDYALLIVPSANGGTSFQGGDWNQGDVEYADAKTRMLAAIATNSTYNEVIAICWNQGESDDNNASFESNLTDFIGDFRSDIGVTDALILMSGQTDEWIGSDTSRQAIRDSMIAVAAADPKVIYHSTVGLDCDDDDGGGAYGTTHFSAPAERQIGAKYATTMYRLAAGVAAKIHNRQAIGLGMGVG